MEFSPKGLLVFLMKLTTKIAGRLKCKISSQVYFKAKKKSNANEILIPARNELSFKLETACNFILCMLNKIQNWKQQELCTSTIYCSPPQKYCRVKALSRGTRHT